MSGRVNIRLSYDYEDKCIHVMWDVDIGNGFLLSVSYFWLDTGKLEFE